MAAMAMAMAIAIATVVALVTTTVRGDDGEGGADSGAEQLCSRWYRVELL